MKNVRHLMLHFCRYLLTEIGALEGFALVCAAMRCGGWRRAGKVSQKKKRVDMLLEAKCDPTIECEAIDILIFI